MSESVARGDLLPAHTLRELRYWMSYSEASFCSSSPHDLLLLAGEEVLLLLELGALIAQDEVERCDQSDDDYRGGDDDVLDFHLCLGVCGAYKGGEGLTAPSRGECGELGDKWALSSSLCLSSSESRVGRTMRVGTEVPCPAESIV